MLRMENVTYVYEDNTVALKGVNIDLRKGKKNRNSRIKRLWEVNNVHVILRAFKTHNRQSGLQ
jgi:hypothetical protein